MQRPGRWKASLPGLVVGLPVAALTVGAAELAAGLLGTDGPVVAVGDAVVDHSPALLTDFARDAFGVHQKTVLLAGIGAVLAVAAAGLGTLAVRRPLLGQLGLMLFAGLGVLAVLVRRVDGVAAALPVLIGLAAGSLGLYLLLRMLPAPQGTAGREVEGPGAESGVAAFEPAEPDSASEAGPAESADPRQSLAERRGFLLTGAGVLTAAAVAGTAGLRLGGEGGAAAAREGLALPAAAEPLPPLPGGAELGVPGLAPFQTPIRDFYRIDTALSVPRVEPRQWSLRVHGMVERPVEIDFDTLLRRGLQEADITLLCVSNEVGGDLVGNTRWLGVPLAPLLREAGVHSGADQILSTSTDGWTCGTPTEAVLDGRDALLAVAMDGEPLPLRHGFPVRMVVPGLYGFVGATKWVTDIELTRFADAQAYWTRRGWAEQAPVKTMSRIDVPGSSERVSAGETVVAGVAWAQRRGIDAVEVRLDGGEWQQAELAQTPGIDTWRQWVAEFDLEPGDHTIEARATDADGHTQTAQRVDPLPDGATGLPSVRVTAR